MDLYKCLKDIFRSKRARIFLSKKQPVLLLEVLIAITILSLAIIPLISPQTYLLIKQKQSIQKIEIDHMVNLLYAEITQKLYENQIDWSSITTGEVFSVNDTLNSMNLPYEGSYSFKPRRVKPPMADESNFRAYIIDLTFEFKSKQNGELSEYSYQIFMIRDLNREEEGKGAPGEGEGGAGSGAGGGGGAGGGEGAGGGVPGAGPIPGATETSGAGAAPESGEEGEVEEILS